MSLTGTTCLISIYQRITVSMQLFLVKSTKVIFLQKEQMGQLVERSEYLF